MFADASDKFWSFMLSQIDNDRIDLPFEEMDMEILCFKSGKFSGSQLNWPMIDKELFALVGSLPSVRHYIDNSAYPARCYTDHRNLQYICTLPEKTNKMRRTRMENWLLIFISMACEVIHIPGESNVWADIMSR